MSRTLAHQICAGLVSAGIDRLYCLPGVQNDDFFNALVDFPRIQPVLARHEQACSYMATGAALASGRAQAWCTVPGQGVLNAAAGHSTAFATSARVLAIAGQNKAAHIGRMHGMLHEIADQTAILAQFSKHTAALRDARTAPRMVAEAFGALLSGDPKPVSLECPLDVWVAPGAPGMPAEIPDEPSVDPDAIDRAAALLSGAKRPLIVLGGGAHDASDALGELAAMLRCPVSALRGGKGAYDERAPLAVPGPVAHAFWAEADVVLAIGSRMQWHEMVWGVDTDLSLIQITADPDEINRRGNVAVPILGLTQDVLPLLISALVGRPTPPDQTPLIASRKAAFEAELDAMQPTVGDIRVIEDVLGETGIFVDDLTQVAYAARYTYRTPRPRGYLSAGYAGTLGWGLPAGIGAAIARPGRPVLVVQGDGGFLYGAAELATAVKYSVPLVVLVYNDNAFGNVQRIQEERFGHNRVIATDLTNPDIVRFAESFGAWACRADPGAEGLRRALEAAFASGGPAVVEMPVATRYPSPWPHIFRPTVRGPALPSLLSNP